MSKESPQEFLARREQHKYAINQLDREEVSNSPHRRGFFDAVYERAGDDPAMVPWADLAAKQTLLGWLQQQSEHTGRAIDIGCGLGDNAECLAATGYETIGFDFSKKAIAWAKQRFPQSAVDYVTADLFDLSTDWVGAFDLVHECYTLQSIPPETLDNSIPAVASLVRPGGLLLVYTRVREDGEPVDGPPWPLEHSRVTDFKSNNLELVSRNDFTIDRPDRSINHSFCVWRKPK